MRRLEAELRDAKEKCKKAGLSRFSASGIDIYVSDMSIPLGPGRSGSGQWRLGTPPGVWWSPLGAETVTPEAWGSRFRSLNIRDIRSLVSVYSTSLRVLTSPDRGSAQKNRTILRLTPLDRRSSNLNFGIN